MADDAKGNEGPLEPHIFQAGMDPHEATKALEGLLSNTDLDADLKVLGGEEQEETEEEDSTLSDQGEREEEESEEESEDDSEDLSLEDDEEWDEEYEEDDDGEEEPLHSVTVDGEDREVTLEELKAGFSFQAHNTQTSQQLAQERTALDSETATVRQSRDLYAERLKQVEGALTEMTPEEPDWEKLEKDSPQRFAVEHAKWQRHQRDLDTVRSEREATEAEQAEDYQKQLVTYRAQQAEELIKAIPAWKDPEKLKSGAAEVAAYARAAGVSEEEIEGLMDHRVILMIRKAMIHDRDKLAGRKKLKAKKSGGKPLKPGARRSRRSKASKAKLDARRRVRSTGSVKDATEFLKQVLPEDF